MAEILTPQQKEAVHNRGGRLLVSAAAGSGKTKVLVDRLLSYITDSVHPANLDDFLIITYTKAAAAELRGKIAAKLSEKIAESPENRHLQRQMQRLYLAKISTVHSYCTDLLREYACIMDIPRDFRVADETECCELQTQILEEVLENAYQNIDNDSDFQEFIDSQGFGRDDSMIPSIILKVFESARCHLSPEKWLQDCIDSAVTVGITDAADTVWGRYLIDDLKQELALQISAMENCMDAATKFEGMEKPAELLRCTVSQLRYLCDAQSWDSIVARREIDYGVLRFSKTCKESELAERIKAVRNACKTSLEKKLRRFVSKSDQVLSELQDSARAVRGLIQLVLSFGKEYERLKSVRHTLDFSDLEHKTLDLLIGKSRSGPTVLSEQIAERYREIMVDEYQDSNSVQDAIFNVLTCKRNNGFMVGDVKQSIYQFRLADPNIFIEKYNTYVNADQASPGMGRKVQLNSNFRSSGGVISAVNHVFRKCMSPEVGGLVYSEEEMLREGIPHVSIGEPEVELYGICVQQDTYAEEASFVAEKIESLLDGSHMIRAADQLRPITAGDIVILLRSPNSVKGEFLYALEQKGIPCSAGDSVNLLQSEEVVVLRSLLQIISNPLQDIPLISTLSSRIFQFTAADLAMIRGRNRKSNFYECLCKRDNVKCVRFVTLLKQLRNEARLYSISELLQRIFLHTSMDSLFAAMPDGLERKRNLNDFCQLATQFEKGAHKDLFHFLEYLQIIEENGMGSVSRENATDSVTIMSIHKSKGLEFPVVFLCGLSRGFNQESSRAQVLCHKELGLGLSCVDRKNRVRYASIAKKAIAAKIQADSISEEMRVLYVAMTRPKDRLIMTYAAKNIENDLSDIALRSDMSPQLLMTGQADCPGRWVLLAAMNRTDAGAFFAIGGKPDDVTFQEPLWKIRTVDGNKIVGETPVLSKTEMISDGLIHSLQQSLSFRYAYTEATQMPSKLTATQLKGRFKDKEAAEDAEELPLRTDFFRKPSFATEKKKGTERGTAVHAFLQHMNYAACSNLKSTKEEIHRIVSRQLITPEQAALIDADRITAMFQTPIGKRMIHCKSVIREFKFSLLEDCRALGWSQDGEEVLIQGVVDCALLEDDGIVVIDFKTDAISDDMVDTVITKYTPQVSLYAKAVSKIYQQPIKACYLYLFAMDSFVEVKII